MFSLTEAAFRTGIMDGSPRMATIVFVFGELAPWVDFTVGIIRPVDMNAFENATGLRPSFTRTIGATISFVGLYFLIERARKIFMAPRREKASERFGVGFAEGGTLLFRGKF